MRAAFYTEQPKPRTPPPPGKLYLDQHTITPREVLAGSRHRDEPHADDAIQDIMTQIWHKGFLVPAERRHCVAFLRWCLGRRMQRPPRILSLMLNSPAIERAPDAPRLSPDEVLDLDYALDIITSHVEGPPKVWQALVMGDVQSADVADLLGVHPTTITRRRDTAILRTREHFIGEQAPTIRGRVGVRMHRGNVSDEAFISAWIEARGDLHKVAHAVRMSFRSAQSRSYRIGFPRGTRDKQWTPEERAEQADKVIARLLSGDRSILTPRENG